MINHALVKHLPTGKIGKVVKVDMESKSYLVHAGVSNGNKIYLYWPISETETHTPKQEVV